MVLDQSFLACFVAAFSAEQIQVQMGIPDFESGHQRIFVHAGAVGFNGGSRSIASGPFPYAGVAHGKHDAGGQAFHVPFPRGGKRLVEIVDVENKLPFGSGKAAKIGHVAIAGGLDVNSRDRSRSEIGGHNGRSAAQESERRFAHSGVTDRQERGQSPLVGSFQQLDGIRTVSRRGPLRVSRAGNFFAKLFAGSESLLSRQAKC